MSSAVYPSLKGRKVLVTGGGSGIGAGLVQAFVAQGCEVSFIDVADHVSETLSMGVLGHTPRFYPCDLTNIPALEAALARIGEVDVLINNAANDDRHKLADVTEAYFDQRIAVNLKHLLFCAKAVAPGMKRRGGGSIINFGSISWHLGLSELVLYETAKAGIEGMTRALARELGHDNIRVNTLIPGNIKTPRQSKWYTPEAEAQIIAAQCLPIRLLPKHVAALALFLASDDSEGCTGHGYWVDAGWA